MSLGVGTRLGPYEITGQLGAGGMGEVYRARDTRLDRTVAIKVMPQDVGADPQFRARFDREARAISQLTHPHICTLYDVGEVNGTAFLVMELLQGQTLADRLKKGALPFDEALKVAVDVADALSAAHKQSIAHRDLKPANIMLTKSGAKLLDFGLAKAAAAVKSISNGSARETASTHLTGSGTILGTLHYMSPEQVEGREADARSDIWALGVITFEMLTGTRPFDGESAASVVSAILKDAPAPVTARHPMTPAWLDRVVQQCLAKKPDDRWQTADELRAVLMFAPQFTFHPVAKRGRPWIGRLDAALIPLAVLLAAAMIATLPAWLRQRNPAGSSVVRLAVPLPPGTRYSSPQSTVLTPEVAVSPDGRTLAFVAEKPQGRPELWVRTLDAPDARLLPGTDDALYPFWSPDGRSIGFFARGKLNILDLAGGSPRTLSDAPLDSRGAAWSKDGTILFAPTANGILYRVPANGGNVQPVTKLDAARKENGHRFPDFLPDGRHFLYTTRSERTENWGISIGSLDSNDAKPLIPRAGWRAQYVEPGFVLFVRGSTLMAQAFDARTLQLTGEAVAVAQSVGVTQTSYASFSASSTGVLVFGGQFDLTGELRWFDRSGSAGEAVAPPAEYVDFDLSPDGRSVAVTRVDPQLNAADLWQIDLQRGVSTRLTSDPGNDASALWSPDGSRLIFRSNRLGHTDVYEQRANGAGAEQLVLTTGTNLTPTDWSPDGRYILYNDTKAGGFDLWAWPTFGDKKAFKVVETPLDAVHGRMSPDGKWIAYASDESGAFEVYVQPFPPTGEKRQVSADGGSEPRWRGDGGELFYLATDLRLMSTSLPNGNPFNAGTPRALFQTHVPLTGNVYRSNYAVTRDGQRFLVNTQTGRDVTPPVSVILNWPSSVRE